jgi:hypothetical protein
MSEFNKEKYMHLCGPRAQVDTWDVVPWRRIRYADLGDDRLAGVSHVVLNRYGQPTYVGQVGIAEGMEELEEALAVVHETAHQLAQPHRHAREFAAASWGLTRRLHLLQNPRQWQQARKGYDLQDDPHAYQWADVEAGRIAAAGRWELRFRLWNLRRRQQVSNVLVAVLGVVFIGGLAFAQPWLVLARFF